MPRPATRVLVYALLPLAFHTILVVAVYVAIQIGLLTGWLSLVILNEPALTIIGKPDWFLHSNNHAAAWLLVAGSLQWGAVGLVLGTLIFVGYRAKA